MGFNSPPFFLFFLPMVVAGYFWLGRAARPSWAKVWLLVCSLLFLGLSGWRYLPLFVVSAVVNFGLARLLLTRKNPTSARRLLVFGLALNILFLGYYKYAGFFIRTINDVLPVHLAVPRPAFPLGISFYTIYQIMFLVDCYEGLIEGHNWLDHFVFAGMFPYVTMGPIVRWKQVVPQLNRPEATSANADNIAKGVFIFVVGLFKKAVLADSFFRWADAGFSWGHPLSLVGSWIAAVAFTFELYFDFSGYTDMAIGAALMLNLELPQNFNAPFRSRNIAEYWRRWHITLTNFITTYLYTPMIRAASRPTFGRALAATFIAMAIAGLWHGADWTFVIFGSLHGVALVLTQVWRKYKLPMPKPVAWLLTFVFIIIALVFFRSANVAQAWQILGSMFWLNHGLFSYEPWSGIGRVDQLLGIGWMLLGTGILITGPTSMDLQNKFKPSWTMVAVAVGLALVACVYANGIVSRSFVYRDF